MRLRRRLCRSLATALLSAALLDCGGAPPARLPEGNSHYVLDNSANTAVIVFVHGVLGSSLGTWTNPQTKAYWPALLKEDAEFEGFNLYTFEYKTPAFGEAQSIAELASSMRNILGTDHIFDRHKEVLFVCHSMGGLVVRAFLTDNRDLAAKVKTVVFYATPTEGSGLANVASFFSRNPQYGQMVPLEKNQYQTAQILTWITAQLPIRSFCAYETENVKGIVPVVSLASGVALCGAAVTPVTADHIRIVKPADCMDTPYRVLQEAFRKTRAQQNFGGDPPLRVAVRRYLQAAAGKPVDVAFRDCEAWLNRRLGDGTITEIHQLRARANFPVAVGAPAEAVELHIRRTEEVRYEVRCAPPPPPCQRAGG